jgi:hypothetical protein
MSEPAPSPDVNNDPDWPPSKLRARGLFQFVCQLDEVGKQHFYQLLVQDKRSPFRKLMLSILKVGAASKPALTGLLPEDLCAGFGLFELGARAGRRQMAPKPRKTERNFIVHYLRKERDYDWPDVRAYLLEHHPRLLKKASARRQIKTIQDAYYGWVNQEYTERAYQEWRKTHPAT